MAASKSSKTPPASVMASSLSLSQVTPRPTPAPRPIQSLSSFLFREGPFDAMDMLLPFVSPDTIDKKSYWDVAPPSAKTDEAIADECTAGKRYAAAYFIFLMKNGPDAIPLTSIVDSMIEGAAVDTRGCRNSFFFYLTRLLYLYSHTLSADDVARDIVAQIEYDNSWFEDGLMPKGYEVSR